MFSTHKTLVNFENETIIGRFELFFEEKYWKTEYVLRLFSLFLGCTWRHHFLKSKTKEPPKLLSSAGMRAGKFIAVNNFSAQNLFRLETGTL